MIETLRGWLQRQHDVSTPSDSFDDNGASISELEDRFDSESDSDSYEDIKQPVLLAISQEIIEKVVEEKKEEIKQSGEEIPAKDKEVLCLIDTP